MSVPAESSAHAQESLALFGGEAVVKDPEVTAYRWPVFSEKEKLAVANVMELTDALPIYDIMRVFERGLCGYFGSKHALSLTNGTAALHSALFAVGVEPGDEVITVSYSYWATVLSIRLVGAIPVFADVLESTGNIDPDDLERKITPRTKAVMLVHLWGAPCEMNRIMEIAQKYQIKVIEDCAHAHGAEYHGKKVGTIGDVGCFSLQASKNMPAIEGGFLLTNSDDAYGRACALGHYGRIPKDHPYHALNETGLGYKYRIHPLAAAIGNERLKTLDEQNARIVSRVNRFYKGVEDLPGIGLFEAPINSKRIYYQSEVRYDRRATGLPVERIAEALRAEGARVHCERYPLQHRQEIYRRPEFWNGKVQLPESLPVSQLLHERVIQLPIFQTCEELVVDQYIEAFRKVWSHLGALR